ncbi:MAG: hypothetical protein R3C59_29350 [Planctomycetaceae bacterium]
MSLTSAQRRYLFLFQCVTPMVINVIVCAAFGVIDFRHLEFVPVRGQPPSVMADLLATSFLLPFLTCLIASVLVHRDVRRQAVEPVSFVTRSRPLWIRLLRRPLLLRALLMGLAGLLLVGSAVVVSLSFVSVPQIAVKQFLAGKLTFAALYGGTATPLIALLAMSDPLPGD